MKLFNITSVRRLEKMIRRIKRVHTIGTDESGNDVLTETGASIIGALRERIAAIETAKKQESAPSST